MSTTTSCNNNSNNTVQQLQDHIVQILSDWTGPNLTLIKLGQALTKAAPEAWGNKAQRPPGYGHLQQLVAKDPRFVISGQGHFVSVGLSSRLEPDMLGSYNNMAPPAPGGSFPGSHHQGYGNLGNSMQTPGSGSFSGSSTGYGNSGGMTSSGPSVATAAALLSHANHAASGGNLPWGSAARSEAPAGAGGSYAPSGNGPFTATAAFLLNQANTAYSGGGGSGGGGNSMISNPLFPTASKPAFPSSSGGSTGSGPTGATSSFLLNQVNHANQPSHASHSNVGSHASNAGGHASSASTSARLHAAVDILWACEEGDEGILSLPLFQAAGHVLAAVNAGGPLGPCALLMHELYRQLQPVWPPSVPDQPFDLHMSKEQFQFQLLSRMLESLPQFFSLSSPVMDSFGQPLIVVTLEAARVVAAATQKAPFDPRLQISMTAYHPPPTVVPAASGGQPFNSNAATGACRPTDFAQHPPHGLMPSSQAAPPPAAAAAAANNGFLYSQAQQQVQQQQAQQQQTLQAQQLQQAQLQQQQQQQAQQASAAAQQQPKLDIAAMIQQLFSMITIYLLQQPGHQAELNAILQHLRHEYPALLSRIQEQPKIPKLKALLAQHPQRFHLTPDHPRVHVRLLPQLSTGGGAQVTSPHAPVGSPAGTAPASWTPPQQAPQHVQQSRHPVQQQPEPMAMPAQPTTGPGSPLETPAELITRVLTWTGQFLSGQPGNRADLIDVGQYLRSKDLGLLSQMRQVLGCSKLRGFYTNHAEHFQISPTGDMGFFLTLVPGSQYTVDPAAVAATDAAAAATATAAVPAVRSGAKDGGAARAAAVGNGNAVPFPAGNVQRPPADQQRPTAGSAPSYADSQHGSPIVRLLYLAADYLALQPDCKEDLPRLVERLNSINRSLLDEVRSLPGGKKMKFLFSHYPQSFRLEEYARLAWSVELLPGGRSAIAAQHAALPSFIADGSAAADRSNFNSRTPSPPAAATAATAAAGGALHASALHGGNAASSRFARPVSHPVASFQSGGGAQDGRSGSGPASQAALLAQAAAALVEQGQFGEAEKLYRQAETAQREVLAKAQAELEEILKGLSTCIEARDGKVAENGPGHGLQRSASEAVLSSVGAAQGDADVDALAPDLAGGAEEIDLNVAVEGEASKDGENKLSIGGADGGGSSVSSSVEAQDEAGQKGLSASVETAGNEEEVSADAAPAGPDVHCNGTTD